MSSQALFAGLVYDEMERLLEVAYVGSDTYYVIDDDGFRRHVPTEDVDRQIVALFLEQLRNNKDLAIEQALKFMGRDDLFTKAALDASMKQVNVDEILRQGIPTQARDMLGMMGFRIIIDYHGEIVRVDQPMTSSDEE